MTLMLADLAAPVLSGDGMFLLLLLPVMLSSIVRGPRSGVAALILGAAGSLLLVPLRGHPWLSDPTDVIRLALYILEGALIVVLACRGAAVRSRPGRDPAPAAVPNLPPATPDLPPVEPLTRREIEVLRLAASGLSIDAIGRQLCLSRNTIKSHVAHAYGKLGAHNRAQAIAAGLRSGCLDQLVLRAWPSATKAATATSSGVLNCTGARISPPAEVE